METIEIILMIIFAAGFGVFFTLWYRKCKDYIELQSTNKVLRESRDDYYKLANARLKTNDDLSCKVKKLKERLNAIPMQPYNITRIETYTPQMKVLNYSTELCPSDFGDMPKEQIIELARDELYKNMFELIKPHILVVETYDIMHMRAIVSGKIVVSDRGGKE